MYRAYEFTYAGRPSAMYGLYVCDIGGKSNQDGSFGTEATISERRLPMRITPLHYGARYNDSPLQFNLVFGSEKRLDRYELQEASEWLLGYEDYQWLAVEQPDMENIRFRCLIQSLTPISVGWWPVAYEAKIICDCPYGYSEPFKKVYDVSTSLRKNVFNDGSARQDLPVTIKVEKREGCTSLAIENRTTGEKMTLENLPSGAMTLVFDCENELITVEGSSVPPDIYEGFNFVFPRLRQGRNDIEFTGDARFTLEGRYLFNVGQ